MATATKNKTISATPKYKAYPKYKPSGVEWIEEIPSNWECKKIKYVAKMDDGGSWGADEDSMEINAKVATTAHITMDGRWMVDKMPERSFNKSEYERNSVKQGDIIVVKSSGSAENIISGKAGYVDKNVEGIVFSNFLLRISTDEKLFHSRYLYYFLTSYLTRQRIERMVSATTYPNLKIHEYFSSFIFFPDIEQQKKLVGFLDEETTKIDEVVAKKQKLIELLHEKRQALITRAVTKGLDPKAKMKPSGIDWLGDIPEEWNIKRVKYLGRAIIGLTYSPEDVANDDEGTLVLRASNIQDGSLELTDNVYVKKEIPDELITKVGDILICSRSGSAQLIGKNIMIDTRAAGVSFGAFMTVFRGKHNDFLYYFLNSDLFTSQMGAFVTSTINQLTSSILNNFEIPVPPDSIQQKIVNYLRKETAAIDKIIQKVETQIGKLQEYRQALISNAVTGKIMVN